MSFAERLRATRQLAGLSAYELSGLAGYSPAHVGHLERGRTESPGLKSIERLAAVLGTTAAYLVSGAGEPPTAETVIAAVEKARAARPPRPARPKKPSQRSREEAATDPSDPPSAPHDSDPEANTEVPLEDVAPESSPRTVLELEPEEQARRTQRERTGSEP